MIKKPLNIWKDIEKTYNIRLDIIMEDNKIVGIHHSNFIDIVNDLDIIIKKLNDYKVEMKKYYDADFLLNKQNKTYIYLFKDNATNLIKIGCSINPVYREKTLQSEKPTISKIFISPLTDKCNETILHKHFKQKRIRGEWFNLDEDEINFIKNYNYGT